MNQADSFYLFYKTLLNEWKQYEPAGITLKCSLLLQCHSWDFNHECAIATTAVNNQWKICVIQLHEKFSQISQFSHLSRRNFPLFFYFTCTISHFVNVNDSETSVYNVNSCVSFISVRMFVENSFSLWNYFHIFAIS